MTNSFSGKGGTEQRSRRLHRAFGTVIMLLLITAMILISVSIFIYTNNTAAAMEAELSEKILVSVEQIENNIDYRLEQAAEAAEILLWNINPYLNSDASPRTQVQEFDTIKRLLSESMGRHMITSLRLFVPDTKIYTNQKTSNYAILPLTTLEGYAQKYVKQSVFWNPTHKVLFPSSEPVEAITYERAVRSLSDYSTIAGVLCADIDISQFYEILNTEVMEGEEIFLIDSSGSILLHNGDTAEFPFDMDKMQVENGYYIAEDVIVVFSRLHITDWYVASTVERSYIYNMDPGVTSSIMVLWIAAMLIIALVLIALLYSMNLKSMVREINHGIKTLEREMGSEGLEASGHEIALPKRGNRLFGAIELDTEQIVRSIADIMESRYRDKLEMSRYQMEALQAQIKPHFLYNTLDVIKWMMMDKKTDEGIWMVNALSKYLRMSINKGEQVVLLDEEISLTKTYLGIMQKRFSNRFAVEYEIESDTLAYRIPKLSLQPLVENALLHGILHCKKDGLCLTLRSWTTEDALCIEVEDNGCGMTQEQVQSLTQANGEQGYGTGNVRKRLDLFAGGECRFAVFSQEGKGTCVTIELPKNEGNTEPAE